MKIFTARNTNEMAGQVYPALFKDGIISTSRNGRVLKFPYPIVTEYTNPWERVCTVTGRDANLVFHHMESLWMLAGRKDVAFLDMFNSNMKDYSDNGYDFNAAYGHRIRYDHGFDQLHTVVDTLANDPDTRQAVILIWDPMDLITVTKDKACNMILVFSLDEGNYVDLMVYNRSNDLIYGGVTGTNPVHFSYFQQWVAEQLDLSMGVLRFVSNNAHVYMDLYPHWSRMIGDWGRYDKFPSVNLRIGDLTEIEIFCQMCLNKKLITYEFNSEMLNQLSVPMWNYWCSRKYTREYNDIQYYLDQIKPTDWKMGITEWDIRRRG